MCGGGGTHNVGGSRVVHASAGSHRRGTHRLCTLLHCAIHQPCARACLPHNPANMRVHAHCATHQPYACMHTVQTTNRAHMHSTTHQPCAPRNPPTLSTHADQTYQPCRLRNPPNYAHITQLNPDHSRSTGSKEPPELSGCHGRHIHHTKGHCHLSPTQGPSKPPKRCSMDELILPGQAKNFYPNRHT